MKPLTPWMLLSIAGVAAFAAAPRQEEEPPLTLRISGLGEPMLVQDGEPFTVEVGGEERTLRVEVQDTRQLCTPEVCLEYPSGFGFEYDPSEGSETWTLDGTDATLLVQVNPVSSHPEDMASEYFAYFAAIADGDVEEQEPIELEVEGLRLQAFRAIMPWNEMEFRLDLYAVLKDEKGRWATTYLIVQEVADRGDEESREVTEARELLARTLTANR